jgi:hypothetical protein
LHAEFIKASNILRGGCGLTKLSPFVVKTAVFVWRSEEVADGSADFSLSECCGLVFAIMVTNPDRGLIGENGVEIMADIRWFFSGQYEVIQFSIVL